MQTELFVSLSTFSACFFLFIIKILFLIFIFIHFLRCLIIALVTFSSVSRLVCLIVFMFPANLSFSSSLTVFLSSSYLDQFYVFHCTRVSTFSCTYPSSIFLFLCVIFSSSFPLFSFFHFLVWTFIHSGIYMGKDHNCSVNQHFHIAPFTLSTKLQLDN